MFTSIFELDEEGSVVEEVEEVVVKRVPAVEVVEEAELELKRVALVAVEVEVVEVKRVALVAVEAEKVEVEEVTEKGSVVEEFERVFIEEEAEDLASVSVEAEDVESVSVEAEDVASVSVEAKDLKSGSVKERDENGSVVAIDAPPMKEGENGSVVASYWQKLECRVPISYGLPVKVRKNHGILSNNSGLAKKKGNITDTDSNKSEYDGIILSQLAYYGRGFAHIYHRNRRYRLVS
uniref:AlNc14C57G4301 protein n=1 Tax=Albugo laibachii Nc14 TaxID=890382 RepID=F0WCB7_9STRA|nr:AlNc14C57G4301 [Albugo laibachii Nc14]|eukprot:CCA18832.1 AlNc14C57G4301 [Albugo laibachii Nc14]